MKKITEKRLESWNFEKNFYDEKFRAEGYYHELTLNKDAEITVEHDKTYATLWIKGMEVELNSMDAVERAILLCYDLNRFLSAILNYEVGSLEIKKLMEDAASSK